MPCKAEQQNEGQANLHRFGWGVARRALCGAEALLNAGVRCVVDVVEMQVIAD